MRQVIFGKLIALLFVICDSDLVVNKWVSRANVFGLLKLKQSCLIIVHPEVFHSDEKVGHVAPREQTSCGPVGRHGLLRLILGCEAMAKCDPRSCEVLVQIIRFLEVLTGLRVLFNQKIVGTYCVPRDGRVWVRVN